MILPSKNDAVHKAWLYRILMAIYSDTELSKCLYFKGGTCAAMLGYLNRFSIDLDFDFDVDNSDIKSARSALEKIFRNLDLEIKDKSQRGLQYFLKYRSPENKRSTVKIDSNFPFAKSNQYKISNFNEINKYIKHQSIETMFANKLLALIGRWEDGESIAGRDVYDVHYFFSQGFDFEENVIKEVRKSGVNDFLEKIIDFVEKKVDQKIIDQDINTLLPPAEFRKIRKRLKDETLFFLRQRAAR